MADGGEPEQLNTSETENKSTDVDVECTAEDAEKPVEENAVLEDLGRPATPTSEGRLTPATDYSSQSEVSKSYSGSGRVTPASQSEVSLTWSSSEKSTPVRRKRKKGKRIEFDNASTSSESVRPVRLPVRPGITWKKGERIEAMDFMQKWYPAKIVDINEEEEEVLIHFEGWNQRYDEWVKMMSDRVGPATRHSDRKHSSRREKMVHKVGEKVYAKWTDCKMYPARINAKLPNGAYEVVFYDGFKRIVQGINISEMSSEKQAQLMKFPFVKQPEPEKPVPVAKRQKDATKRTLPAAKATSPGSSGPPAKTAKVLPKVPKLQKTETKTEKKKLGIQGGRQRRAAKERQRDKGKFRAKKSKLVIAGSFVAKPERHDDQAAEEPAGVPTVVKSEPVSTQTDYNDSKGIEPESSLVKKEIKQEIQEVVPPPDPPLPVETTPPSCPLPQPDIPIVSLQTVVPSKAFVVEPDHNQYKCVFEGCTKAFRKEHLLDYHVKYYHMEDTKTSSTPQAGCKRKRRKTTSVCSTDSETSSSGRQPAAKKHRHVSAESFMASADTILAEIKQEPQPIQQTHTQPPQPASQYVKLEESLTQTPIRTGEITLPDPGTDPSLDAPPLAGSCPDTMVVEGSVCTEGDDILERDEVVNCICEFFEENGLMIQCEVCLCWQHASCFGITDRTLPKKYVCFICENPPGVRAEARFLHEQDWFKQGRISTFGYVSTPVASEERYRSIKATHSLVADMHHLNRVLHGLKLQLKVLRSKDEKELQLWQVNWDDEGLADDSMETTASPVQSPRPPKDFQPPVSDGNLVSALGVNTTSENPEVSPAVSDNRTGNPVSEVSGETVSSSEGPVCSEVSSSGDTKTGSCEPADTGPGPGPDASAQGSSLGKEQLQTNTGEPEPRDGDVEHLSSQEKSVEDQPDNTKLGTGTKPQCSEAEQPGVSGTSVGGEDTGKGNIVDENNEEKDLDKEEDEAQDEDHAVSDSTESAPDEDPAEVCERNLLQHIMRVQAEIASKLDMIDEQVSELEMREAAIRGEAMVRPKTVLSDVPLLKRSLRRLNTDLSKVKRMAEFHH